MNLRLKLQTSLITRILLIGILLFAPCLSQAEEFTTYRLDLDMIEVPFEYYQHQILIKAKINDTADLTFMLDTGATSIVLHHGLKLNLEKTGTTEFREAEGTSKADTVNLTEVSFGNSEGQAHVGNLPALVTNLGSLSRALGRKIDGIMGIAAIAGYVVEFDYAKRVARFYPRRKKNISNNKPDNKKTFLFNLTPMNLTSSISVVSIKGRLHESYDYDFLFDTGFGGHVTIANAPATESGILTEKTPRVEGGAYSLSRKFNTAKIRAPYLKIGEIDYAGHAVQVDFRNGGEQGLFGIVGNRFLQSYRVTLDYVRKKLWLERNDDPEDFDEIERPSFGIALRMSASSYRVDKVTAKSPAHVAGIRPGDTLVAINGKPLAQLTREEIFTAIHAPTAEMTLTIAPGVDPNLGVQFKEMTVRMKPGVPLDW